jgi:uncharacterized membrane protein
MMARAEVAPMHRSADLSLNDMQDWGAIAGGLLFVALGLRRSTFSGVWLTASAPLFYRGVTGHWPPPLAEWLGRGDSRVALAGERGVQVRESVRLERSIADVFRFWRRLENLPTFVTHLERVEETSPGQSHWVARGPADLRVEWDAEIINEVDNQVIAWRSLPDSDVVTAGSVNFDVVRAGRSTQVTVNLQYAPPGGKAGAFIASLLGREPSQTIREDLRRFKQLLEAGELARAGLSGPEVAP